MYRLLFWNESLMSSSSAMSRGRWPPPPPPPPPTAPPPPLPPPSAPSRPPMCLKVPDVPPGKQLEKLDIKLAKAVLAGYPFWKTGGQGGTCPKRIIHDFAWNSLRDGARIDFCRGTKEDDLGNKDWVKWLERLPHYAASLRQAPTSVLGRGNAMEQAVGLSYAAATQEQHMQEGILDWTRNTQVPSSQSSWAEVWTEFRKFGFGPILAEAGVVNETRLGDLLGLPLPKGTPDSASAPVSATAGALASALDDAPASASAPDSQRRETHSRTGAKDSQTGDALQTYAGVIALPLSGPSFLRNEHVTSTGYHNSNVSR